MQMCREKFGLPKAEVAMMKTMAMIREEFPSIPEALGGLG